MNRTSPSKVRIAHLSDLHLPLPGPVSPGDLLGKRLMGWSNLRLIRGRSHRLQPFQTLLAHLADRRPDLVVITGDLVNLALDEEFAQVGRLFQEAGLDPARCMFLPGNHDRYTRGADRTNAFERGLAAWLPPGFDRRTGYPLIAEVGPLAVAGLDTAVWRGPLRAAGRLDSEQLVRLSEWAQRATAQGQHLVVALHHPPIRRDGPLWKHYRAGLAGYRGLQATLAGRSATVLTGHEHRYLRAKVDGLEIFGAPSASMDAGLGSFQLAYHLFTFDRRGLERAEAIRHWPSAASSRRFQRIDLLASDQSL